MEEKKNLEVKEDVKVEENGATTEENNKTPEVDNEKDTQKETKSVEEVIEQLRLENAKLKRATDKATKEASSFKKQLRDKQTVEEIQAQEKAEKEAERDEKFKSMEKELAVIKFEKNFVALGYPEEKAHKSALAQYEGDTETLFAIQKEMQEELKNEVKAEFIANNPEINSGEGEGKEVDPFLEGFNSVD